MAPRLHLLAPALGLLLAVPAHAAAPGAKTVVFCAPGSPGTAEEAQPAMDAFAAALAGQAGLPAGALAAAYAASEEAGVARLGAPDAALALVSLPFFLKHEKDLALRPTPTAPVLQGAGPSGPATGPMERWSLVAKKKRVPSPAALHGMTILSTAGYAPGFVRAALAGYAKLPKSAKIAAAPGILSALRKAAAGEPVAVLLDGAQATALPTLPFAADLEVVARSAELPVGIVATVNRRLPSGEALKLDAALRGLASRPGGAAALAGIRMSRFAEYDPAALGAIRDAYAETAP